jgi:hypothetical protein
LCAVPTTQKKNLPQNSLERERERERKRETDEKSKRALKTMC